jgi:hypothetical protein
MPFWFYPLMLVIILAGYVFLFLQLRAMARARDVFAESLRRHLERIDLSLSRMLIHKPEGGESAAARDDELRRSLGALEERVERLGEAVSTAISEAESRAAGAGVAQSASAMESPAPPRAETPESVARRFLLEEGFSAIHVLGREERDDGIRLRVRAMRGDQLRSGHVTLSGGSVLDASMEVPTSLFP